MKRPIPPSHFKTKDDTVREDLRRIRAYLEQLTAWVTDISAHSLTEVDGNLRYLLRAANDFASFPTKAVPDPADVLLIEDAADAFEKKYVTLASLPGSGGSSSLRNPVWDPPVTPNADDDEFTVDTLASGVWTVAADTAIGTPFTRAGDVNPTSYPAAGTFRSTLRGSSVLFQAPANTSVSIYKQVTPATAAELWMGGASASFNGGSTNDPYIKLQVLLKSAGLPDLNNRMMIGVVTNGLRYEQQVLVGGAATVDPSTIDFPAPGWAVNLSAPPTVGIQSTVFTPDGMQLVFNARAGWGAAVAYCGFRCNVASAGGAATLTHGLIALHFIRRKPGAAGSIYG